MKYYIMMCVEAPDDEPVHELIESFVGDQNWEIVDDVLDEDDED